MWPRKLVMSNVTQLLGGLYNKTVGTRYTFIDLSLSLSFCADLTTQPLYTRHFEIVHIFILVINTLQSYPGKARTWIILSFVHVQGFSLMVRGLSRGIVCFLGGVPAKQR